MSRDPVQLELFHEPPIGHEVRRAEERALQKTYDDIAAAFGLPAARVVLSPRRATGGVIAYGPPHVIRISSHMSAADRLQTLLHEAAHAICHERFGPEEGHSRRFWQVARRLGVKRKAAPETDRLHSVRAANARYAYRCPGCTHEWTRRSPFGRTRLCAVCERAGRPARLILVRRPKPRRG
jgi:predicted SprT family Zn-dependent metalloprotease